MLTRIETAALGSRLYTFLKAPRAVITPKIRRDIEIYTVNTQSWKDFDVKNGSILLEDAFKTDSLTETQLEELSRLLHLRLEHDPMAITDPSFRRLHTKLENSMIESYLAKYADEEAAYESAS